MTVKNGREFLAIPGPTTVPDEVLSAMHRPAVDLYDGEIIDLTMGCLADLKRIFRTRGSTYIYPANGHGAWEAALTNCLSRGDKVLSLESGMFGKAWSEMAEVLGIKVEAFSARPRRAIDPAALLERLRADREGTIKAILAVQIDTAAGIVNDIPAIAHAVEAAGHPALLMVDAVASLACMPFEMDAWGIDVAVAGSQKGLMTPPGLGFVAVGPRAHAAHRTADLVTRYYALLADATRAAVSRWAEGGAFELNVLEPSKRSNSVTTVPLYRLRPATARDLLPRAVWSGPGIRDRRGARRTRDADRSRGARQCAQDSWNPGSFHPGGAGARTRKETTRGCMRSRNRVQGLSRAKRPSAQWCVSPGWEFGPDRNRRLEHWWRGAVRDPVWETEILAAVPPELPAEGNFRGLLFHGSIGNRPRRARHSPRKQRRRHGGGHAGRSVGRTARGPIAFRGLNRLRGLIGIAGRGRS